MVQVFLGGSCNPTKWRNDITIPILNKNKISFYNPQVEEWNPDLVEVENYQKKNAEILFFVIDNNTRSILSMLEIVELILQNRRIILVIKYISEKQEIDGIIISEREKKDLNRARFYIEELANRNDIPIFNNIEKATNYICSILKLYM